MLITFHYFGILLYGILKNRKRLKKIFSSNRNEPTSDGADHETSLKFHPPVFKQRLSKVYQTLIEEKWRNDLKKLVDFGCAEFDLFMYLKNLNLEQITFVDIDETALRENLGKLEPLLADRLRRRTQPLEVLVFRGSAIDPDYRLRKTDVVTAIELIEHLFPDTLEALPYNIFSFVKPKLVIITTPNADFNVVFQREGLRHPDHKFEWTRQQFEDWATNITLQFTDYTVEFTGVGKLSNQSETLGHCSQGAIFIRKDLLNKAYISPAYAKKCRCDNASPCKGQTTECKLLCNCLCALCLPDFSVGICRYLSRNIKESEAYRPMKTWPKLRGAPASDMEPKLELFSNFDNNYCDDTNINPLYNIFYKLIMKIDYPYEVDLRSETERLMEMFKYRIDTFSCFNNRFYNQDTGQCEIPLIDIVYGDICVSNEEIRHLLSDAGYKLEKCIIPQLGYTELCVISVPRDMDDIESTSESEESHHNSLRDESSNVEPNIDPATLSDWDETPQLAQEPNPDPLFDSGYLNSPSPLDAAPQEDLASETDQFEEASSGLWLGNKKLQIGKENAVAVARPLPIIMTTTNYRTNLDPRKNELDRFHNMAAEYRAYHFEVPGTSYGPPNHNKLREKFEKKLFKEPTVLDDAKSLANIILQNSLNIINEDDVEIVAQPPALEIMDLLQEPPQLAVVEAPIEAMENGDLANNNRDNEGNNLEHNRQELEVDEGIDLLNDNLEDVLALLPQDNVNLRENNNELLVEAPAEQLLGAGVVQNEAPVVHELENSESLARASREALFDENSEQDLLEDFDIMMPNDDTLYRRVGPNIPFEFRIAMPSVLLPHPPVALEQDFPEWLLHLLSNHFPDESDDGGEVSRFPSHCYCQGDGLGVHPSTLGVDEEDSDTSSNNTEVDFAEVDPGPSDMFDMSSLLEESSLAVSIAEDQGCSSTKHDTEAFIDDIIKLAEEQVFGRFVETNESDDSPGCSTDLGQFTPCNSLSQDGAISMPTIGSYRGWMDLTLKLEDQAVFEED